jgi:tRNA threonylcarbamoyl adenosine modification protein (Sua5/YciO/YrdC/YwlC family)
MVAKLFKTHPDNPEMRKISQVVECLRNGGVIIYPTDTVYGIGCDIHNQKAVERICQIKNINPKKRKNLSFICNDLSHIAEYARIGNATFKLMKKALPGPYTFILETSSRVPKILNISKKNVGIRIPDNNIARMIVEELGNPIITSSVLAEDEVVKYLTDPEDIYEQYKHKVDMVIDGGNGTNLGSTIVDCSDDNITVLRQGAGDIMQFI